MPACACAIARISENSVFKYFIAYICVHVHACIIKSEHVCTCLYNFVDGGVVEDFFFGGGGGLNGKGGSTFGLGFQGF